MKITIGSRACCRCWKDLTDAASMEVGVGPICRKLDNKLLAIQIKADIPSAQRAASQIDMIAMLPEPTHATFGNVLADVMDFSTVDWRVTVKRVEWILSWGMTDTVRSKLIAIVVGLGYMGLAALLRGEAATGITKITFENGRLVLRGPRNKTGAHYLKKIGGKFHQSYNAGVKPSWSISASKADEFALVVMTYWPNFENLEAVIAEAKAAAPVAIVEAAPVAPAPVVTISEPVGGWCKIKTPYNAAFVQDLKKLPYPARKWDSIDKVWVVDVKFIADVQALVQAHYKTPTAIAA